jgi:hypothetical protein
MSDVIEAPTIKELENKVREWTKRVRGTMEVHEGWDRARVEKTATGNRIFVHAHT